MAAPRIRLLISETVALGPGKAALLRAIEEAGSISGAARAMSMSYRRAWDLVDRMNADFTGPLVERVKGGRGGGGARLTELGKDALGRYERIEDKASHAVAQDLEEFAPLLRDPD